MNRYREISDVFYSLYGSIGTDVLALKTAPDIPRNSNFNSLTTVGNYRVRSYSDSATMSNIPVQTAGTLYVKNSMLENGANYKQQVYVTHQNVIYLRYTSDNGSTWSDWDSLTQNSKLMSQNIVDECLNIIPANSNINNYYSAGVYRVLSDSDAGTMQNLPYAASGKLIVIARTGAQMYTTQFYMPSTGSVLKIYVRNYSGGSWTNWEQLAFSSKSDDGSLSYTRAKIWPGTSATIRIPKDGSKGVYRTYTLNVSCANNAAYAQYILGTQNATTPYLHKVWHAGTSDTNFQNPISSAAYDSAGTSIVITFSANSYWYVNMVEFSVY